MIDGVSPACGERPLSLIRPAAWPLVTVGPTAADSGSRELAAVVLPSGECGCGVLAGPVRRGLVTMVKDEDVRRR